MALATDAQLGMSMRFTVNLDEQAVNLGSWSKVTGLDVTWDLVEYHAGDGPKNERWYFPGRTKYSVVKLERAVEADGTKAVQEWLAKNSFQHSVTSGKIELQDAMGAVVFAWTLRHVLPVKWSVTPFDSSANKVALETLEIAHMGFLENE